VIDEAVIVEAGQRLLAAAPAGSQVILFGSQARRDADENSDLDFLVIEPDVKNPARESVRLRRALDGMLVAADIVVVSEESVRQWREVYGTVIHSALSEGRPLEG